MPLSQLKLATVLAIAPVMWPPPSPGGSRACPTRRRSGPPPSRDRCPRCLWLQPQTACRHRTAAEASQLRARQLPVRHRLGLDPGALTALTLVAVPLVADLVGGAVVDAQGARAAADVHADLGPGEGLLEDVLAEIPRSARRNVMGNKGDPWGGYQIHWRLGRARSFSSAVISGQRPWSAVAAMRRSAGSPC
jgi:hypothetical protein